VPVLGVLLGISFLALVVVSIGLVVFVCTGTRLKLKSDDEAEMADFSEMENKE
jgi:hypothetical protein